MESKTAYAKLKTKVSEELSKDGLKSRVSSETMSNKARKWRRIAFVVFGLSSVIVSPVFPFTLTKVVIDIAVTVQLIGAATGLGAQTNKSKKK